ncbi:hypothetical protein N7532_005103 [Penicillium argentinense]|uniref:Cysteine-rich transmembrane CYSTM domain-containing protein n=1 Tax=Penicillium argentinense TaxID=1131581 RepID=A0A9W9KAL7_9EURO|nr:uncharacterized protein N7532_005103 [Penicillium argentinense]KAJ5098102.1 hypothetical protein N7532_005103 [Penicillium argentinense]
MLGNVFNWFSPKRVPSPEATRDATTTTVQNQQPSSPDAPSAERVMTEQPIPPSSQNSQENMRLRGGGAGDVCCGVCAGLLCFECCEDCC